MLGGGNSFCELGLGLLALGRVAWKKGRPISTCLLVTLAGLVKVYPLSFLPLRVNEVNPEKLCRQ